MSEEERELVARVRADEAVALDLVRRAGRSHRREDLLERVAEIQRLISARKPLQEVLDAITAGARDLTGADIAGLRLVDSEDPGQLVMPSLCGVDGIDPGLVHRSAIGVGVGGMAYSEERLVVADDYATDANVITHLRESGVSAAIGAPVTE